MSQPTYPSLPATGGLHAPHTPVPRFPRPLPHAVIAELAELRSHYSALLIARVGMVEVPIPMSQSLPSSWDVDEGRPSIELHWRWSRESMQDFAQLVIAAHGLDLRHDEEQYYQAGFSALQVRHNQQVLYQHALDAGDHSLVACLENPLSMEFFHHLPLADALIAAQQDDVALPALMRWLVEQPGAGQRSSGWTTATQQLPAQWLEAERARQQRDWQAGEWPAGGGSR